MNSRVCRSNGKVSGWQALRPVAYRIDGNFLSKKKLPKAFSSSRCNRANNASNDSVDFSRCQSFSTQSNQVKYTGSFVDFASASHQATCYFECNASSICIYVCVGVNTVIYMNIREAHKRGINFRRWLFTFSLSTRQQFSEALSLVTLHVSLSNMPVRNNRSLRTISDSTIRLPDILYLCIYANGI